MRSSQNPKKLNASARRIGNGKSQDVKNAVDQGYPSHSSPLSAEIGDGDGNKGIHARGEVQRETAQKNAQEGQPEACARLPSACFFL